MTNKIAIIIVVYKNYEVLIDLLNSFSKQKEQNFHLFICDLSDNKETINQSAINNSQLTIIPCLNKGYSYGVNIGIKKAIHMSYDKFCVLNDDTIVSGDFIQSLNLSFKNNPSSIIGGKIYYSPGFEYHKNKYDKKEIGNIIWYAGGTVDWKNSIVKHNGVDEVDNKQFNKYQETEFVTGCLMCFDKKVIDKVGFWDESYFLYFEDADYCERAKQSDIKLYYHPSIVIWHKNAQSTDGSGSKIHQQYQNKNQIKFALKYAPFKTKLHIIKNYLMSKIFST